MRRGRYQLIEKLASGGMGEVFLGRTSGAGGFEKLVAIKTIHPARVGDDHREMFVREAKIVARMSHPNIAQVYELNEDADGLYIVMEFIDGVDLSRLIKELQTRGQHLSPEVVAVIAFDALNALDHAHRLTDDDGNDLGIVHRDVSPHNLLLTRQGFAKLCDFGVARIGEGTGTREGVARGKLPYIAPEQFLGGAVDGRADLFSLGAVIYEMLCASKLMRSQGAPEALELFERGIDHPLRLKPLDGCPSRLLRALHPALYLDVERRYPSAELFRHQLERYLVTTNPVGARHALADLVGELRSAHDATTVDIDTGEGAPQSKPSPHWTRVIEQAREKSTTRVTATVGLRRPRTSSQPLVIAGGALLLAVLFTALWLAAPWGPVASTRSPATPSVDTTSQAKRRPRVGYLSLSSRPLARVFIDGVDVGTTPLSSHPLRPGRRQIRLEGPHGKTEVLEVRIRARQTVTKFVSLE